MARTSSRAPKGSGDDRVSATIRIPSELHARLSAAATADDRSVNSYIIRLLEQHVPVEVPGKKSRP